MNGGCQLRLVRATVAIVKLIVAVTTHGAPLVLTQ